MGFGSVPNYVLSTGGAGEGCIPETEVARLELSLNISLYLHFPAEKSFGFQGRLLE